MKAAQQALWIACFLIGIWLGARAGSAARQDSSVAGGEDRAASAASSTSPGKRVSSSGVESKTTPANTASHRKEKPGKPEKIATLEDLRQLLDMDLYEADLRGLFHRLERINRTLPVKDMPAAAQLLWVRGKQQPLAFLMLGEITSRWADHDPKAVLAWVKTLQGNEHVAFNLRKIALERLGDKSPALLWAEISQSQEWMDDRWREAGLMGRFFGEDAGLMRQFLSQVSDPGFRNLALGMVFGTLAKKDAQAALELARSLTDPRERESALNRAYGGLAAADPAAALAALRAGGDGMSVAQRETLLRKLADKHPESAREFITSGGIKAGMQREAEALARGSAKPSADLIALASHIPAGAARDGFLGALADMLAGNGNLEAAWKALQDVKPGIERQGAMQGYSKARAAKSTADATAWLSTLPAGHDRDAAIRGFVFATNDHKPQMACEWALAMTDAVYREDVIESAFTTWHNKDARAANAWLGGAAGLNAAQKDRLRVKAAE